MLSAEKRCCKVRHESNWSIELHHTSILCTYWIKHYKGIKNNIDVSTQTQRLHNKLPETIQSDIDILIINTTRTSMLRISKQQLRLQINHKNQLHLDHQTLRRKGLLELKQVRLSRGQQKEAEIIGKIAATEMRKADCIKLRNIFNPRQKSGISNIEIPEKDYYGNPTSDPDKAMTWKRITGPKQVEAHVL
jgi:hypothetical protein